jgi:predicted lipid-binding transport protein (Tim44 family)
MAVVPVRCRRRHRGTTSGGLTVKRLLVLAFAVASVAMIHADLADAARMGGGRSLGMQRSITPPAARTAPSTSAAPSTSNNFSGPAANPVMPARPGATAGAPAAAAAAPAAAATGAAASRTSRWLGPIAGIAAGLGLAALFSHFGLSEGLGSLLLIGVLVIGAIALIRLFVARRAGPNAYQYAGAGAQSPRSLETLREPANAPGWGPTASAPGRFPPGFEPAPFIDAAKQQFRRLQAAYDRGDHALLADVTTPQMLGEITRDITARGPHSPTEIVALDAEVIEVMREGDQYVASVRFHGALREDGAAQPQPFEEMWNLVKPVDGSSGWLLAGIQQYA